MVVIVLPIPKFVLQVVQRDEFMQVKEFITQSTVERCDQPLTPVLCPASLLYKEADYALVSRPRKR